MSRLGCKCGHVMGSTESPSPYSVYVYYESEINQAIFENKNCLYIFYFVFLRNAFDILSSLLESKNLFCFLKVFISSSILS